MPSMKFSKEFMQNTVWECHEETEVIEDKIYGTSRWSELHEVVFSYKGKFYSSGYSKGSTECQYECAYEYADDEIECTEVHQVDKVVKAWVPIEKEV